MADGSHADDSSNDSLRTSKNLTESSSSQSNRRSEVSGLVESAGEDARDVKVVIIGESSVGKSTLALRFVNNTFIEKVPTTIGASYLVQTMQCPGVQTAKGSPAKNYETLKFNLWDTAGQEKYRSLAALYYRGVDGAIVVYDITDKSSFDQLRLYWMDEIKRQCGNTAQICIVGNKCDLEEQRQVASDEGRALANLYKAAFFEASAKNGDNIHSIFLKLGTMLPPVNTESNSQRYRLDLRNEERRSGCC